MGYKVAIASASHLHLLGILGCMMFYDDDDIVNCFYSYTVQRDSLT